MKKVFFIALVVSFISSFAFAAEHPGMSEHPAKPAATEESTVTIKGTLIDNKCAADNKGNLAEFIKTHTMTCVIDCAASGFAIFSNGKLTKFDKASNAKIEKFLKAEKNTLDVTVTAKKSGDELSLVSIENQK